MAHLLQLKAEYSLVPRDGGKLPGAAQRSHGLNKLFEAYIHFNGKSYEDIGDKARFFGGGRRLTRDHSRDAFSWVDNPAVHKLTLFRETIGEPPDEFPTWIQNWAHDLRGLLGAFSVKNIMPKINSLDVWLLFLIKLGEKAPKTWQAVNREQHISHAGLGTHLTLVQFMDSLDRGSKQRVITDLQKAWHLAAVRDGFAGRLTCPIDFKLDHVGWGGDDVNTSGRTRRKALPEAVYQILIAENLREDFGFARSILGKDGRSIHNRWVSPQVGSTRVSVFWPAAPIALDMALTSGMRQSSAIWMDSGEGDESWIDTEQLTTVPNPLPSRTKGRSEGFLRICRVGLREEDNVLGMFLAINKTGAYEVPWVDPRTADLFKTMRDWQVQWNPRTTPVRASRSDIEKQYAGEGLIKTVYPLMRDPASQMSLPITPAILNSYWTRLLAHCEPIVEEKLGYREPLILNGRARWDLHSLRVTTISILLENGIQPWIVQELVGHKSVAMTFHYKEVNPRETHRVLRAGYERRRLEAVEALQRVADEEFTGTEEELEDKIAGVLGGIVRHREDNIGTLLFRTSKAEGSGYEVFSHGVCPGGDCKTGGPSLKNSYHPVFRPRACSRCRHRLTGPAFLAGLVHRLNSLMVEIKASMDKEANLNGTIEEAEDQGHGKAGKVKILRGIIARERECRDELWAEWCAELATIRMSEQLQDKSGDNGTLPTLTGLSADDLSRRLDTVHQLSLLHTTLTDGDVILGGSLEVSDGLQERRDALLLEVARNNNLSAFFYRLDPSRRRMALDRFGDLLLDHLTDVSDLQKVLDGFIPVAAVPALEADLRDLMRADGPSDFKPEVGSGALLVGSRR